MSNIVPPIVMDGFAEIADVPSDVPTNEPFAEMAALARFTARVHKDHIAVIVTSCAVDDTRGKYVFRPNGEPVTDSIGGYGVRGGSFSVETAALLRKGTLPLVYEFFYYGDAPNDELIAIMGVLKPARAVVSYRGAPGSAAPAWSFFPGQVWLLPFTNRTMIEVTDMSNVVFCGSYEMFTKHINALSWYRKNTNASNVAGGCKCFNCGMVAEINDKYGLELESPHDFDRAESSEYDNAESEVETVPDYIESWADDEPACVDTRACVPMATPTATPAAAPTNDKAAKFAKFKAAIAEHSKMCHEPDLYTKLVGNVLDKSSELPVKMEDVEKMLGGVIQYEHKRTMYKSQMHFGQIKLLYTEIQFLTKSAAKICVYAGGAESCKGAFLAYMFPHIKFLLVDPRPFDIRPYGGVFTGAINPRSSDTSVAEQFAAAEAGSILTYNGYFTLPLARALKAKFGAGKIAFISDIRTVSEKPASDDDEIGKTGKKGPTEADIIVNNAQQTAWVHALEPETSMLKFRHPFYDNDKNYIAAIKSSPFFSGAIKEASEETGINFLRNAELGETVMYAGEYYIQPYAPVSSCEVRLHITGVPAVAQRYKPQHHDAIMYTVNNVIRPYYYRHHAGILAAPAHNHGFDGCFDCNLAYHIMTNYTEKYPTVFKNMTPRDIIFAVMEVLKYKNSKYPRSFYDPDYSHGHKYSNMVDLDHYNEGILVAQDVREGKDENITKISSHGGRNRPRNGPKVPRNGPKMPRNGPKTPRTPRAPAPAVKYTPGGVPTTTGHPHKHTYKRTYEHTRKGAPGGTTHSY